jgi:DNA-binding winged helix-turn-helix (wHTH) protein/tetratricopeptide (TPR) repeat protein
LLLKSFESSTLRFGVFTLDRAHRKLLRGSEPISLPAKAFDLLVFFVENPGRPLLKEELLQSVWPGTIVEESNLPQNVFLLRKALGAEGQQLIVTLPGRGYQFAANVVAEETASAAISNAGPALLQARHSHLIFEEETEDRIEVWRSPLAMAFAVVGVLLLVAVGWLGWQRYQDHVGGPPVQLVMADFDGGTGDPVLDRTLQDVLRFELLQSPFVSAVTPGMVKNFMIQMRHDPSERLTVDLARDICERSGSQAVLHGNLARLGHRYILMEEATSCADGTTIGSARQDVDNVEDLPTAVSKMAAALRHDMGESRRMIARFNRPLSSQNTNSLEALKAFSQAGYLNNLGKYAEAVDLLKRAVVLDPKFAAAYFSLWDFSFNTADALQRKAYLQKAYDLREFATEPTKLAIMTYYEQTVTGDLEAHMRDLRAWTEIYPHDMIPWTGLAEVGMMLGRYPESIAASKHALELDPRDSLSFYMLAKAQMQTDDFEAARKTCDLALAKGIDTELIRDTLLGLGHVTHDAALVAQQEQWAKAHPPAPRILLTEGYIALSEGRANAADEWFSKAEDAYRQQGDATLGLHYRQGSARAYFETGWPERARAQLNIAPIVYNFNLPDDMVALAETGKPDLAESMLQEQLAKRPGSTRWNRLFAPHLHATIHMLNHRPVDALAAMAALNGTGLDDMAYTRGLAYMETSRFPEAEAQLRKVVDHPGLDPTSYEVPLAQLQLARLFVKEGRKDDAIKQYDIFLQLWKDADKDSSILKAAQAELANMK